MSYFELNGHACMLPGQLYSEFTKIGLDCSDWYGLANEFVDQRGVDPSYGHFICQSVSVNAPSVENQLKIIDDEGVETNFSVKIDWARKIGQASTADKGYYLVRVVDDRYALANELLGKRFNHVINYVAAASGSSGPGTFSYHEETLNKVSETLTIPYSWEKLFDECWKIPSGAVLDKAGITFPTYVCQPPDWRHTTRRDALEMLLQWLNLTIVYDHADGKWKLKSITGNAPPLSLLDPYIVSNAFTKYKEAGEVTPNKLKLYFARTEQEQNDVEEYKVLERTPSASNKTKQELHLRLPAYYTGTTDSPVDVSQVADDFLTAASFRWAQFPPQEKTFRGFHLLPPSSTLQKVVYYQHDLTGYTYVQSTGKQEWLIVPDHLPGDTLYMALGVVTQDVLPGQTLFQVTLTDIESGRTNPDGQTHVLCVNDHKKLYKQGETISLWQRSDSRFWRTNNGGGTTTNDIIRFELAEDLDKESFTAQAYLLDASGAHIQNPDTGEDLKVLVGNAWQIHQGKGPRTDGLYGEVPGYRGHARFKVAGFDGPIYEIEVMESQARWVIGKCLNEINEAATSFPAHVDKFWGAFPNDREPVTEVIEEGTSQDDAIYGIKVWDELDIIRGTIAKDTKYLAVWDEENNKYILTNIGPGESDRAETYALLVRDIPKAEWTLEKCEHGYADAAAIIFTKQRDDPNNDESPHFFKKKGARKPVINPNWPEIIKAGETTNAEKPVVARGYLDPKWTLGDGIEQEVFVLTSVVYPISWVKGTASSVSGSGNITITGVTLLWGRDPKVSSLSVANPEGWEGPAPSLVYAMQLVDGTWLAMYVTCPTE